MTLFKFVTTPWMKTIAAALTLATAPAWVETAKAQNLFEPVVRIDDQVITRFELNQRRDFLAFLSAPGDLTKEARKQLIDDRLRMMAAKRAGIEISEDEILAGFDEFASRANLSRQEFLAEAAKAGIAEETVRDFIVAGLAWRAVVRTRFGSRAGVTDSEIDRATKTGAQSGGLRVLLSEIILPMPPGREQEVQEIAKEIAQIRSISAFTEKAKTYSAAPTRDQGGRVPWQKLFELPPVLQPLIFGLKPGEVTEPLPIPNGIALFQLRAMQEVEAGRAKFSSMEYAVMTIPNRGSDAANKTIAQIRRDVDSCDDLYGVNFGKDPALLTVTDENVAKIPNSIKATLRNMDENEFSFVSNASSQNETLIMLCGRSVASEDTVDSDQIALGLRNRKLSYYADAYLEDLRQDARIR